MEKNIKPIDKTFMVGKWMPSDQETLVAWMKKIMAKADKQTEPLLPVIENLKNFFLHLEEAYFKKITNFYRV